MSKKPITPVIEEDQNALDDETFEELAADEEGLHAALQNPQSIRSGQATSNGETQMWQSPNWLPPKMTWWLPEQRGTPRHHTWAMAHSHSPN